MTWRCPHCGTPQPEAARCWVCRRSSTCCATCRYFGRAVVSGLGFCLLDRQRVVRRGDELEACWTARPPAAPRASLADSAGQSRTRVPRNRTFVPVLAAAEAADLGARPADREGFAPARPGPRDNLDAGFWDSLEGVGAR